MALNACSNREQDSEKNLFLTLQGIWERTGYGDIYVIGQKQGTLYQYTRATCLLADKLDKKQLGELLVQIVVQKDNAAFTAISPHAPAFRWHFSRLQSLPEICRNKKSREDFVPSKIFEHVWHTFNDYYAFFEERGVDWQAQYRKLYVNVDDGMNKHSLFVLLCKMLSPIDDGHVYLYSRSEEFCPEKPRGVDAILSEGFQDQTEFDTYHDYFSAQMARYQAILRNYLDKSFLQQAGGAHNKPLEWGTIDHHVGYLSIKSMTSISTKHNATALDDVKAIQEIMDRVMRDLGDTESMIIDVRFNGGGDDTVALAIANRFTDQRRLAMTKTTRSYRGETLQREAYLMPEGDTPYLKPVVVIAGPDSASATEIFVIAMRALPHITQLGEPTNGILSDELFKSLPMDWEFTLSNEVYYDHMGVNHEVKGIIPHVHAEVFSLNDLETGRNSALEAALKMLAP